MKKIFALLCLSILLFTFGCNKNDNDYETMKKIPIFEGVSLVEDNVTNKRSKINEDLLPDYGEDSNVSYFAKPNEEVLVEIHLYNPDSFEILSLTFANKKYQSFEFKEGSTGEKIIISFVTPSSPGEYEYEISGIKYVDKQAIKDVDMSNGNKKINFGVSYQTMPTISIYDENITETTYNAKLNILDNDDIINDKNGIRVFLFDDQNILIENKKITDSVDFENLDDGKSFLYVIAISFDALDGEGSKTHILYEEEFDTLSIAGFKDIMITEDTLSYDVYIRNDEAAIVQIRLFDNDNYIDITNTRIVENLLSNHKYKLVLSYEFMDNIYEVTKYINTLQYGEPSIKAFNVYSTKNTISYDYELFDESNMIIEKTINLYLNGVKKVTQAAEDGEISNLLSNTNYVIELVCKYDLKDGTGIREIKQEKSIKTLNLNIPLVSINYKVVDNIFCGSLSLIDTDNTFKLIRYELCDKNGSFLKEYDDIAKIDGLRVNTTYQLKLIYSYNLNDGNGDIESTYSISFSTSKQIPELNFSNYFVSQDSFGIDIYETDPNVIGEISAIRLFSEESIYLKSVSVSNSFVFEELEANTNYIVKVYYVYDLDDGNGSVEKVYDIKIKTAKNKPNVDYSIEIGKEDISIHPNITDLDMAGSITNIKLYLNGVVVKEGLDLEYNNLLSNKNYQIELVYTYNLDDLSGVKTISVIKDFKTLAKEKPILELSVLSSDYRSLSFNYSLNDTDGIFKFESAILLYNDMEILTLDINNLVANDLYTNGRYTLIIYYSYDLNDGNGRIFESKSIEGKTLSYDKANIKYDNLKATENEIFFDYKIVDMTGTLKITKIELYSNDGMLIESLEDLSKRKFSGLSKSSFYRIVTTYTYNLGDGNGLYEDKVTQEYGTSGSKLFVNEIEVLNSSALIVGDEAHVRISFDNPNNLDVRAFYINDMRYEITQQDLDKKFVVVKFIPESFGGYYDITLTGYSYIVKNDLNDIEITENLFTEYVTKIAILGDLGLNYFGSSRDLPFAVINEKEVSIRYDGTKGYQIEQVVTNNHTYSKDDLEIINNSEVRFAVYDYEQVILKSIKYSLGVDVTEKTYNEYANLAIVSSNEIISIDSCDDFSNMVNHKVYEIVKDIDFKGYKHTPIDFDGVLIGNNHKINNFSIVENGTIEEIGLFKEFRGYAENIVFSSPYISSKTVDNKNVGVLAGSAYYAVVKNINVLNCYINTNHTVGGVFGYIRDTYIEGVKVTGEITGYKSVGGIVGVLNSGEITIKTAINYANVYGTSGVGGIVGGLTSSVYIFNAMNYGSIKGEDGVGGIIGSTNTGVCELNNILNVNNQIIGNDSVGSLIGNINVIGNIKNSVGVGPMYIGDYKCELENTYTTDENCIDHNKNLLFASKEMLNSKEFWLNLGFDDKIWDLSELNFDKGLYPKMYFENHVIL